MCCLVFASPGPGEAEEKKQGLASALLSFCISCICYCLCFEAVLVSLHWLLLLFFLHMLHLLLLVFDAVLVSLHFKEAQRWCWKTARWFGSAPQTGLASCVKCILKCFVVGTCDVHFITRRNFIKALADPECPDSLCNIKC